MISFQRDIIRSYLWVLDQYNNIAILVPQAFIDAGVPHVCCVKIDAKLHDADAVNFTRHFYSALAQGFAINVSVLVQLLGYSYFEPLVRA